MMCVDSDNFDSAFIMLTIERRLDNGLISSKVYAGKKTFCLSEDLTIVRRNGIFKIPKRFLCRRPVIPDYLFVSYDYDLTKLVNTNLKASHDITDSINDKTIKQELATINTEMLNMKSDTENAVSNILHSSLENAVKQKEIMEQNLLVELND